ncbi:hypothetical protein MTO96_012774 [Rhipicephalus appendiculatus]
MAIGYAFNIEHQKQTCPTAGQKGILETSHLGPADSRRVSRVERFIPDQDEIAGSTRSIEWPLMLSGTRTEGRNGT